MILHLDLDSFFVSAERTKDKRLLHKEVAVGGRSDQIIFAKNKPNKKVIIANSGAFVPPVFFSKKEHDKSSYFKDKEKIRGIITTASYEARGYGLKTGMSIKEAISLCPKLIVLPPNHLLYHTLSFKLKHFLEKKLPLIEQYSIDEFFAETSGWIDDKDVFDFALTLKNDIKAKFDLPISIGIAKTKWIAKLATNTAKPDGVKIIYPKDIYNFIKDIPIKEFPGIGRSWENKLSRYKKSTLGDVYSSKVLLYSYGREGKELYDKICGKDNDQIEKQKDRKSIGISRTFDPILERKEIKRRIYILSRHLSFILTRIKQRPTTIFLGIKYEFKEKSKKRKTFNRIFTEIFLKQEYIKLFDEIDIYKNSKIIRLSMSLTNFNSHKNHIYSVFDFKEDCIQNNLYAKIGKLREKYGIDIIKHGIEY